MLLTAQNARIILLTGTPMINYPNELGILFNILRGYIYTWEISLDVKRLQYRNYFQKVSGGFPNKPAVFVK